LSRSELLTASPGPLSRLRQRLAARRIRQGIDRAAFQALRERYRAEHPEAYESKYWSLDQQLRKNVRRAFRLRLHRTRPGLRILDLGTGFGYFPLVCRHYGHHAVGTDLDDWAGLHLYRDVTALLGVERLIAPIVAGQPLPDLGGRFDLVTGFACLFDRPPGEPRWGRAQWESFVEDLASRHLEPGGMLLLMLNRGPGGEPLDAEARRWFLARGAAIDSTVVCLRTAAQGPAGTPVGTPSPRGGRR
jgi:SAM-dependent methyltransferase